MAVKIGGAILGLLAMALIIYGSYWLTKTASYTIFYEAMVQETVRELVKPEYLK